MLTCTNGFGWKASCDQPPHMPPAGCEEFPLGIEVVQKLSFEVFSPTAQKKSVVCPNGFRLLLMSPPPGYWYCGPSTLESSDARPLVTAGKVSAWCVVRDHKERRCLR